MSYIWSLYKKAFDDARNELAVCKTCSKVMKIPKSRTTSNLLEHVRKKHPEELEKAKATASTKSVRDYDSNNNNNQTTIDGVFARKINPGAKKKIDQKLCQFIATSSLPLRVVTLDSFKELLASLNGTYSPPSYRTLVKLMAEEVASIDRKNSSLVSQSNAIAITADCWSTPNANCSLLGLTAHVISAGFEQRHDVVLDCITLTGKSHTAEVITEKITESLTRHGVCLKNVICMVADGAAVMKRSANLLHFSYVHCCAHVINLVIAKLSRSAPLTEFYKRCLEKANMPLKVPVMDCPTRWGSTYDMLCTVLDSVTAFEDLLAHLNKEPLEHEELKLLESMRILLAPFHNMTKLVCCQRANVSIYIGIGRILISETKRIIPQTKKTGKAFGEALLMECEHYFDEWFKDEFLQFASLSDQRFAFLESIISEPRWKFVTDTFVSLIIEIQQYAILLKQGRPPRECDPVEWWKTHKEQFPILAEAVPKYITPPPTSVDCERLFSLAGLIYNNRRRNRMKGETARMLLLMKAHNNSNVARESKSWGLVQARNYRRSDETIDSDSSSEESSDGGDSESAIDREDDFTECS
ncbi:hypothetical protein Aduo_004705 [Ancylostoma duodenale]